ncbi:MAG: hypothetical protein U0795_17980 [Pirellulales bacterium]
MVDQRRESDAMEPDEFARRAAAALGTQLQSVILYGSAAAGDFVPGISNYNLLMVVEPLGVDQLDRLVDLFRAWCDARRPPPLLFSAKQLASSLDAFPIELLDIRQSRKIIWGEDVLARLQFCPRDLRLQIERELTGKLLSLRSKYTLTGRDPVAVRRLMLTSHSTFLVLFRAALRLFQDAVPDHKLDALNQLARHLPFNTAPFHELADLKCRWAAANGEDRVPDELLATGIVVEFSDYLQSIEDVIQAVNRLENPREGNTV